MTTTPDITIIGGGIIGLLTARAFFNAGATVNIIEKNRLGQEASWAGGGILLPLYPWRQPDAITQLTLQSLILYPNLAAQLLADTGLDPEWTPCGLLITKNPDIKTAVNWCTTNAIPCQPANEAQLSGLNIQPENPLWLPSIAQARNPRLVKSLIQDLRNKGVAMSEHCELTAVKIDKSRITAIGTTSGQFTINQLIIATGAWTGRLFQEIFSNITGDKPKIKPVKGQMLLFDAKPDTLPCIVLENDHYLIPRRDGKILAGSTVEQDEFNKTTTSAAYDKLKTFALNLLPTLNNYPLTHHWAGLRPGTNQGVPYIDNHPDISNLSINAGHFRNGLVMGPASAQLLVDLVLQRPPLINPEPYQLSCPH
ncbi:MAG: glycine oxidase ThiO [Methylovulum sp.]|nr:glycine oxidase ThiO [Methylovulum sp.]